MKIPNMVITKLKNESDRLDSCFSHVWGLLPNCRERDKIMLNIIKAKEGLNQFIENHTTKENEK